jgi:hypothetical protein
VQPRATSSTVINASMPISTATPAHAVVCRPVWPLRRSEPAMPGGTTVTRTRTSP